MKLKTLVLGYLWGVALFNAVAFFVWLKDITTISIDLPTVLLTTLFSLVWPISLFGDFMASHSMIRGGVDLAIAAVPFILGFFTVQKLNPLKG
jgi:hypothetical protein